MDQKQEQGLLNRELLEKRPGIFIVGSPNVGKRTLLSRLVSVDFEDVSDSSSDVLAYGWTINTKYYTAEVSIWMAHLHDELSIANLPMYDQLAALVMVFDTNDASSFLKLKEWASHTDLQKFDILLCIGNKVDLLPGHPAHTEYRRCLLKFGESTGDFSSELEYGISETEGSSLLGDEEPSLEIKRPYMDWCIEHNIEYIEACASNADFDKCLSVDGDSQGVERFYGAVSAHMWPGMVLKSGDKINVPSLPEPEELSEEESEFELEYEILSSGSADPWDEAEVGWVSADGPASTSGTCGAAEDNCNWDSDSKREKSVMDELRPSVISSHLIGEIENEAVMKAQEAERSFERDEGMTYDFEDLEQLMSEIGNTRDTLRLLPDFQRREMAAKLATKMASMFGDSSEDEEDLTDGTNNLSILVKVAPPSTTNMLVDYDSYTLFLFPLLADILASSLLLMVVGEINWVGSGSFAFYCPIEYMKFGIHRVEMMIVRVLSFQKENFFKDQPGTNNDAKCHS